jgi:hypothetical protein
MSPQDEPTAGMGTTGRLVISADDFGLTAGVNRAILDAFEQGTISSTTILLGQPGSAEALRLAATMPSADFGIHLNLTEGLATSGHRAMGTLLGSNGQLRGAWVFAAMALTRRLDLESVRAEVDAQLATCLDAGIALSHADSHHHVHGYPGVDRVIRESLSAAGIPLLRANSFASLFSPIATVVSGGWWRPSTNGRAPGGMPRAATDYVVSLAVPRRGPLSIAALERVLAPLNRASVELVVHPVPDAELAQHSAYVEGRADEMALLGDPAFQALVERRGFQRASFADPVRKHARSDGQTARAGAHQI